MVQRLSALVLALLLAATGTLAASELSGRDARAVTRSGAGPVAGSLGSMGAMAPVGPTTAPGKRPNMVLILMDDFSLELLATMPNAQRMVRDGATYDHAFVIDSLCCPSRASLLTGQMPHQTGVLTNTPNSTTEPIGGYEAFRYHGNDRRQFSLTLRAAGYRTGFVGKFLNGYRTTRTRRGFRPPPKVPGWTSWQAILAAGYNGWDFNSTYLDRRGRVRVARHPKPPRSAPLATRDRAYVTNVTSRMAVDFLRRQRRGAAPYFLEIATYGPHAALTKAYPDSPQFPSAFADRARPGDPTGGNCGRSACGALGLDDLAGYGDPREDNAPTYLLPDGSTEPAPPWRTNPVRLTDERALQLYRDRARMVQSIDRMIARVRRAAGPDTYVFLTSDNGYHLGQHQLNNGKGTPYDSDSRVPLVVVGPGVVPGTRHQFVNNIDLAPTFEELARMPSPSFRAGRSFAGTLAWPVAPGARYAFFEHTQSASLPGEVDDDPGSHGVLDLIPSYIAVRGERGLLVRLDLDPSWSGTDYAYELYRYDRPWEDVNVFAEDHDEDYAQDLLRRLEELDHCAPAECRAAVQ